MRIQVYVSTGYVGGTRREVITVPDEELEDMSLTEREEVLDEHANQYMRRFIDWGWEEVAGDHS